MRPAEYAAHLNHDETPVVLLCRECAAWERDCGSVEWVRSLHGDRTDDKRRNAR